MTEQRRVIARVLSDSDDHPDVEAVYRRATEIDPHISIATVIARCGCSKRRTSGAARFRRRAVALRGDAREHHDHLIDMQSGRVIEFRNEEIEKLQRDDARKAGYRLVGHRLELYAVPLDGTAPVLADERNRHPDNGAKIGAAPMRIYMRLTALPARPNSLARPPPGRRSSGRRRRLRGAAGRERRRDRRRAGAALPRLLRRDGGAADAGMAARRRDFDGFDGLRPLLVLDHSRGAGPRAWSAPTG